MWRTFSPMLRAKPGGFRMWMPNMPITLISASDATATMPAKAVFRVLPKMTKHEIKEYLTKIYGLPVKKVNTMNYLGKRKRLQTERKMVYWRYADYKKAIVSFDSSMQSVGTATNLPNLDDDES
ncbi:Ribosomal protein L23 [Seminavis robusta]|uniref:Large ribosomal subunit protein uL23m n=1 Tax=Seminavis robusta TaxID=568900 RepID=A0A9N8EN36_9STRA|nr:Ribosomal protein L23 [Seminavis robusta]|eukprot:Sro1259_g256950.1 Ribosomal protein L23 (124) ;mRNA; r:26806-27177